MAKQIGIKPGIRPGFATLLAAAVSLTACFSLSASELQQQWTFRVHLDQREIGYHEFRINRNGESEQVEINARFDVKILFFNAYQYEHQNLEVWQGNCLAGIESETNDNGDLLMVSGEDVGAAFEIETHENETSVNADCVHSFAYWNPVILNSQRLLNSQTGKFVDITVTRRGFDTVGFGDVEIDAVKYTIETADGPIDIWYTLDETQWLALEAPAKGGRTIRYEPVILPGWPDNGVRLAME